MYDFFEIATANMVQNNLLGELVHAEGAYIHDLRALNFSKPIIGIIETSKSKKTMVILTLLMA